MNMVREATLRNLTEALYNLLFDGASDEGVREAFDVLDEHMNRYLPKDDTVDEVMQ